jgi:hypothetical protein
MKGCREEGMHTEELGIWGCVAEGIGSIKRGSGDQVIRMWISGHKDIRKK